MLSCNPNITWSDINDNPKLNWRYSNISLNPNITFEIVKENPKISRNYELLSANKMSKHPYFNKQLSYILK